MTKNEPITLFISNKYREASRSVPGHAAKFSCYFFFKYEKLNLFCSMSQRLIRKLKREIFRKNFPRSLGSLSQKIGFLTFFYIIALGHESKIWEHDLGQTATLHGNLHILLLFIKWAILKGAGINKRWLRNYSDKSIFKTKGI